MNQPNLTLQLEAAGRSIQVSCDFPRGEAYLRDLVPLALQITDTLGELAADEQRQAGEPTTCQRGCAACCRELVVLSPPEVFHLMATLDGLAASARSRVTSHFDALAGELDRRDMSAELLDPTYSETPPHVPIAADYVRARFACPCLHDEECSIYPARPLACRTHGVTSPPSLCDEPGKPDVRKIRVAGALAPKLAWLTADLLQLDPCMVPLPLALRWAADHANLAQRRWPAGDLLKRYLAILAK